MKMRLLKPKLWAAFLVLAFLCLLLWPPIHQVLAVAAVQNSLERAWEINFDQGVIPPGLPASVDSAVESLLERMIPDTRGSNTDMFLRTQLRRYIYQERFRAFFRGPISTIEIYSSGGIRGDLGTAVVRFPGLRYFIIDDSLQPSLTEPDWRLLCTHLRALPDLEGVQLSGTGITDAAFAPLAGHPKIRILIMRNGTLTDKSIQMFTSMPSLRELVISGMMNGDTEWPTKESQIALKAALPNVKINVMGKSPDAEPTPDSGLP